MVVGRAYRTRTFDYSLQQPRNQRFRSAAPHLEAGHNAIPVRMQDNLSHALAFIAHIDIANPLWHCYSMNAPSPNVALRV